LEIKNLLRVNNINSTSKGQASLEFALVIPILILIILIVSQLGYLVYIQNLLEQAAREGARILATTSSDEKAGKRIENICINLDKNLLNTEIDPSGDTKRGVGDIVTINLTYNYDGPLNLFHFFSGSNIFLKSSSSMRMECN
jgi:Flp pilus assembly protein TadG